MPVANSLIGRGVTPAAAFAFLLSAPAINPVVLTATAIAFPASPVMVLARVLASLATAVVMGWLCLWLGREEWLRPAVRHAGHRPGQSRWTEFRTGFQHDFLHAGGFLVVGAMAAATFNVAVPRAVLDTFAGSPWLSVLFLAALAIILAVCSEADAFVASSLTGFSPTARLAFTVTAGTGGGRPHRARPHRTRRRACGPQPLQGAPRRLAALPPRPQPAVLRPTLAANTWVTITGTWHAGGTLGTSSAPAALDGVTVEKVAKPVNAYQDALPFPASR